MPKTKSKAIQTILSHHQAELFEMINNGASLRSLNEKVTECLDEAEATGNKSVPEAREIFRSCCAKGYNCYLSTLMTYMTGMKVS